MRYANREEQEQNKFNVCVMVKCKQFPDKEFTSKEEMFTHLRENADKIIAIKMAEVHKSNEFGELPTGFLLKSLAEASKVGPHMKDNCVYPIINTTRYLDHHDDCHFDGIWNKSAKEQNGKLYYVCDHEIKIDTIIAWPSDVNVMVKSIPWSWVGKDYPGNTEALIYEIPKDKIVHQKANEIIKEKRPVQNSVRMMYLQIKLGMNSTAEQDKEYKAYYDSKVDLIANKEVAEEQGYFFGVEEAKIVKEGSMVILGSNDATSVQQKEKDEADTITSEHKDEPVIPTTQTKQYLFNANII